LSTFNIANICIGAENETDVSKGYKLSYESLRAFFAPVKQMKKNNLPGTIFHFDFSDGKPTQGLKCANDLAQLRKDQIGDLDKLVNNVLFSYAISSNSDEQIAQKVAEKIGSDRSMFRKLDDHQIMLLHIEVAAVVGIINNLVCFEYRETKFYDMKKIWNIHVVSKNNLTKFEDEIINDGPMLKHFLHELSSQNDQEINELRKYLRSNKMLDHFLLACESLKKNTNVPFSSVLREKSSSSKQCITDSDNFILFSAEKSDKPLNNFNFHVNVDIV
jgi:hypothetical protein